MGVLSHGTAVAMGARGEVFEEKKTKGEEKKAGGPWV